MSWEIIRVVCDEVLRGIDREQRILFVKDTATTEIYTG